MTKRFLFHTPWFLILLLLILPVSGASQGWEQKLKLVANDRASGDRFGHSVSISGDYAIVGAYLAGTDTSGENVLYAAGAAYIFVREGDVWIQQQKLIASDRDNEDCFGFSVSIYGNYAIIGAYGEDNDIYGGDSLSRAGSAYIFMREGNTWTQQQKIVAEDRGEDDYFGYSVSIYGDYAVVGACKEEHDSSGQHRLTGAGSAYIFVRNGDTWTQQQKIVASDRGGGDWFGMSAAIHGNDVIIGAGFENGEADSLDDEGAAYIFTRTDTTWHEVKKLLAYDRNGSASFGYSVSISGDYLVAGASDENYDTSGNIVPQAGAAYVYKRSGEDWVHYQKIFSSDRTRGLHLGYSVSIDGDHIITGGPGPSKTNIFARSGDAWNEQAIIQAGDHLQTADFGNSVGISGNYAIIGAPHNYLDTAGGNPLPQAGAAYIFVPSSGSDVNPDELNTDNMPHRYRLDQNYPNPFNPSTKVSFVIGHLSFVTLKVYDIIGREISILVNEKKQPGEYTVEWNADGVPGGIYFYRITAGDFIQTKKMALIR